MSDAASSPDRTIRERFGRRRRLRLKPSVVLVTLVLALIVVGVLPRVATWTLARGGNIAHAPGDLPRLQEGDQVAAIVLGAGLKNNKPTPLLDDRISAAADLYKDHRVNALIVSGDNTTRFYDEPSAMRQRALDLGVPASAIAPDYAGRRTWDTCVRAKKVFGITRAIVVTSSFHIDRAVATCRAAGIETVGYSVSDARFSFQHRLQWRVRELPATTRALLDAWIVRPEPADGGAPIDPFNPCSIQRSLPPAEEARNAKLTGLSC
ncbi:MAG: YdcF family protein [Thermoleophilia bacterium]|nr:YdcF family protein [Thermoleophilia bacterium]